MNEKSRKSGYLVDAEGHVWIGTQKDFGNAMQSKEYSHITTQLVWDGSRQVSGTSFQESLEKEIEPPIKNISPGKKKNSGRPIVSEGSYPDQFVQIVDGRKVWVGPSYELTVADTEENGGKFLSPLNSAQKLEIPDTFPLSGEDTHSHHFIYEEPNGRESSGYCKHCGKQVRHNNWSSASDFVTSGENIHAGLSTYELR